jgi:hypothetical protein
VIIGHVGGTNLEISGQLAIGLTQLREARERGLAQWL